MLVHQAYKGMLFRYSHIRKPTPETTHTYIIIDDPFVAHGRRVVKAKCIETGQTIHFNNHMFEVIELLGAK